MAKEEQIINNPLDELIGERFGRYSKYVIQERALPDARDGLKPVQRRIVYAMDQLGLHHDKSYKKSARIVGEVIGKYHPHGDTSVYDAMVRLSQDWKLRQPLIDMHGNNGSIDGDGAAAMRYTETRLSAIAKVLVSDIEKKTVRFSPNFDDSEWEPTVLPAGFPTLLANGASGIAAGYATNIPPHNLSEIIEATIHKIENPEATFKDIKKFIKGPDFPTGGIVEGRKEILEALKKGKGRVTVKSKAKIIQNKKMPQILITEIPYEVNKASLVRRIDEIRLEEKIPGIKEVRDETDRTGLRICIDLQPDADAENILNYCFKNTQLQTFYSYNMVSIVNSTPVLLGVNELIDTYITHRRDIVLKRTSYLLDKTSKRLSIILGLIKAISNLEEVIKIIRGSNNKSNAKENLMNRFAFKEPQAEAIVSLRLYRLTSTDIEQLENEKRELETLVKKYNLIIHDENELNRVIIEELNIVKETHQTPRRTEVRSETKEIVIDSKSLIKNEECIISITRDGYIKKIPKRSVSASEGIPFGKKETDLLISIVEANSLNKLLVFTTRGNYAVIDIHKIKESTWKELGNHINDYVKTSGQERILTACVVESFNNSTNVIIASKDGLIKRVDFRTLFANRFTRTLKCINIKPTDEVVAAIPNTREKKYIIVSTEDALVVKYLKEAVAVVGPKASGVKSIKLKGEDKVASIALANDEDTIAFITTRGKAKRVAVQEIPFGSRTTKGKYIAKKVKSNPQKILAIFNVKSNDKMEIDMGDTTLLLKSSEIPTFGIDQNFSTIKNNKSFNHATKQDYYIIKNDPSAKVNIEDEPEKIDFEIVKEKESSLKALEKMLEEAEQENDMDKTQVLKLTIDELMEDEKEEEKE